MKEQDNEKITETIVRFIVAATAGEVFTPQQIVDLFGEIESSLKSEYGEINEDQVSSQIMQFKHMVQVLNGKKVDFDGIDQRIDNLIKGDD